MYKNLAFSFYLLKILVAEQNFYAVWTLFNLFKMYKRPTTNTID